MLIKRMIFAAIVGYTVASCILGAALAELALHPPQVRVPNESGLSRIRTQPGARWQDVALVASDGVRLQGWYLQPHNAPTDAVILLHGVGSSKNGMIGFATEFLSKGYSVLIPDSRGHGSSGGIASYGIREAMDVSLWYKWLRRQGHTKCICGLGESMGGAILLQSLNHVPFCSVVVESPFASFREIAYLRVGQFLNTGSWPGKTLLRPAVEFAFVYGWLSRGVWLPNASPEASIASTKVPVLLIHGTADANIPLGQSERIFSRHSGPAALWMVPNAGHCGASAVAGREFYERVIAWFALHNSNCDSSQ
jgi:dipeptidyl aminopeptidase/acylaminoacyl peptidase